MGEKKVPVISSMNLCEWIQVPQIGDSLSFTVNSCSEAENVNYATPFSPTGPTTYSAELFSLEIEGAFGVLSNSNTYQFKVLPHCTDVTTMIAPTLPPQNFDFQAGMSQYKQGDIPAFDDTKSFPNTKKCGLRTCTSDSPYAVWS